MGGAGLDSMLTAFLQGRDIPCPGCGYNLRDLQGGRCTECGCSVELGLRQSAGGWSFAFVILAFAWPVVAGVFNTCYWLEYAYSMSRPFPQLGFNVGRFGAQAAPGFWSAYFSQGADALLWPCIILLGSAGLGWVAWTKRRGGIVPGPLLRRYAVLVFCGYAAKHVWTFAVFMFETWFA